MRRQQLVVAFVIGMLFLSSSCDADASLSAGKTLTADQQLKSGNGFYIFVMQGDCNLVLYRVSDHHALWSTRTDKKASGCKLVMQSDGNLVIYSNQNLAVWSSRTNRVSDRYTLEMQNDGNVVIYTGSHAAIWGTNTVQ